MARGHGGKSPPIARLEFLRSRVAELVRTVEAVDRNPRRILRAELEAVPYWKGERATGTEILSSFQFGRVLKETGTPRLPAPLKGCLPERIRRRVRRSNLDIREHREMKACLESWSRWLAEVAELLEDKDTGDFRI